MPVMINIIQMFKVTYPDLYQMIYKKLIIFLLLYVIFLTYRSFSYYYVHFVDFDGRENEIIYYISELMLIGMISYIGLKNLQNQNNELTEDTDGLR